MSKIYKVSEVASLPASGEYGVLYLVEVDNAKEAYVWNGSSFEDICPKEWKYKGFYLPSGGDWPEADISDIYDEANEFCVRVLFPASNGTDGILSVTFPKQDVVGVANGKNNYLCGYYYDASYNACTMIRYDSINKTIQPIKSWTHKVGSDYPFDSFEILYR